MKTTPEFEALLANLIPDLDVTKDPTETGRFSTRMRTYVLYTFVGRIKLPEGTELTPAETPDHRKYTNATVGPAVDAVKVHFFDEITPNVGEWTVGLVEMKIRTREPVANETSGPVGDKQVKLYEFYVNVKATEEDPVGELVIHRTTENNGVTIKREYAQRRFKDSVEGGHFAHFNYSNKQSRFQHVEVRLDRNAPQSDRRERRPKLTSMAQALQEHGLVAATRDENLGFSSVTGNDLDNNGDLIL